MNHFGCLASTIAVIFRVLKFLRYRLIIIGLQGNGGDDGIVSVLVILVAVALRSIFGQFAEGSANLLDRFALVTLLCTYGTVHLCFVTTLLSVFKKA